MRKNFILGILSLILLAGLILGCDPVPASSTPEPNISETTPFTPQYASPTSVLTKPASATMAAIPDHTYIPSKTATPTFKPSQGVTYASPTTTVTPVVTPMVSSITPTPFITNSLTALVTRVIDGDTIEISLSGQIYTVRYIGVDTPETVAPNQPVEPFGPEASSKNKEFVLGQTVRLEKDVSETDKYGRLLRYVYVGDLFINAELVRLGYAQVATYPPDVKYQSLFLQMQNEARNSGRGLWGITASITSPPSTKSITTTPPSSASPAATANVNSDTVYITNTGTKYHRDGCSYLSKSKIPISRADAIAKGYDPCSVCKP